MIELIQFSAPVRRISPYRGKLISGYFQVKGNEKHSDTCQCIVKIFNFEWGIFMHDSIEYFSAKIPNTTKQFKKTILEIDNYQNNIGKQQKFFLESQTKKQSVV